MILWVICICSLLCNCSKNDTNSSVNIKDTGIITYNVIEEKCKSSKIIIVLNEYEFNLEEIFDKNKLCLLNQDELAILRNSIYAKHGYIFTNKKYDTYFKAFNWYRQKSVDINFKLNKIDVYNIDTIIKLEDDIKKLKYNNSNLGFTISFPINWRNKYRIDELDWGIIVYFKSTQKPIEVGGEFFIIINTESEDFAEDEFSTFDNIKYFNACGNKYFIGGTKDVPLTEDHPEFEVFIKMRKDMPKILETIKSL